MSKRRRTFEKRCKILEHVDYEVKMLVSMAKGIASGVATGSGLGNAMVESFALHTRNLIDFLWPDGRKSDYVLAEEFLLDPEKWKKNRPKLSPLLKKSRIRAHKEIAHLSYDRLLVDENSKDWQVAKITEEILSAYRVFLKLLPPKYKLPESGGDS